ncbi:transposase [Streptomyces sp. NPDC052396]|uniref:transposase n=1 Tax=Streptomyces sp. NPDC052396 TaxID=3365689 RepID=UPI0037D2F60C
MPTGYTWSRIGQRAVVPREDTRNRRVNVLGAKIVGTRPDLVRQRTDGKIDAVMLLDFTCAHLAGLPGGAAALELAADSLGAGTIPLWRRPRPCTVVLDNASAHTARMFKGRREQLAKTGVELLYLPPRSPELNDIERIWRAAKYKDYPQRVRTSIDAIGQAVGKAMTRQRDRIRESARNVAQAAQPCVPFWSTGYRPSLPSGSAGSVPLTSPT